MATTSELKLLITAKDDASKKLKGVNDRIKGMAPTFKTMAVVGTAAFAGIAIAAKKSIEAFQAQERAEKRLETLVKNTTDATDEQIQSLKNQAAELQKVGVVGDEVTMAGQSQLATFALTTDKIDELTPALLDMLVATKGVNATQEDSINVANAVGRALEGGAGALTRYGISLTENQKKEFENANKMERASLLTEILTDNYGGLNKAARETSEGGMKALLNDFGDMQEKIGGTLVPILDDLVERLLPVVERIMDWIDANPELVKNIFLIVAAVSGLLAVFGTLGLILPAILTGIGALFSPIGIAILVIIALIVGFKKMWESNFMGIRDKTQEVLASILAFYDDYIVPFYTKWMEYLPTILAFWSYIWDKIMTYFKIVWALIAGVAKIAWALVSGIIKVGIDIFTGNWEKAWEDIKGIFSGIWDGIKTIFFGVWDAIEAGLKDGINSMIGLINNMIDGLNKVPKVNIPKIGKLALGGPVASGQPYIVGEHRPEVFVPSQSGNIKQVGQGGAGTVNINFGGVTISNEADENRLVEKIKRALSNESSLGRMGIT